MRGKCQERPSGARFFRPVPRACFHLYPSPIPAMKYGVPLPISSDPGSRSPAPGEEAAMKEHNSRMAMEIIYGGYWPGVIGKKINAPS